MKLYDRIYLFFKRIWHVLIYPVVHRYKTFKNQRENHLIENTDNIRVYKITIRIKILE